LGSTSSNNENFVPRSEHPRPNMQRADWRSLNGPWRFAFDPQLIGEQMRWYAPGAVPAKNLTITVPFPWESPFSGVARPDYKGAGWYEREFTVPADWQGLTPFLHFGAVDWHARVWINGQFATEHNNGYLPFSVDLSRFVQAGEQATVTVRAFDIADATTLVGKQVPWWYTYSSGIWQPVWLEARAPSHISAMRVAPDITQENATVKLTLQIATPGAYQVQLRSPDQAFTRVTERHELGSGEQHVTLRLDVPDPQLWSPETPHLYDLIAELEPVNGGATDRVDSYFGMRRIERAAWDGNEYEYILLNGEPVYLRGALDQAFHPDSLHAYPTDAVIRGDIELAKELGLNMLRCHIKINDPRYYYWADKLGLLILYDLPSPALDTPAMQRIFAETLPRAMARDFNSPSIFAWVLFNETWGLSRHHTRDGQRWLAQMVERARALDPTRLIEDNSPCRYDHVESDVNSWHFYINDYQRVRQHIQRVVDETYPGSAFNYVGDSAGDSARGEYVQGTAPLMNSEYGGIAARMGDQDIAWCFKYQTTELRRHAKICGYVYTELDDIEWEHNGFVNYDRSCKEFGYDFFVPGMTVADLNQADFVGLDAPPCQTLAPGSELRAPLFVSHWGEPLQNPSVRWDLTFTDRFGAQRTVDTGTIDVAPRRFDVLHVGELTGVLPAENGLATVAVALADGSGAVRCRNYVNIEVRGEAAPSMEEMESGWALRFQPGAFSQTSWQWPPPFIGPDNAKFSAQGSGWVEYAIRLPDAVDVEAVQRVRLLCEAGARAGRAKIDWPQQLNGFNYPQTEADTKYPTDVRVTFNGHALEPVTLPDDPADARGVLSHHRAVDPGSYGYLAEWVLDGAALRRALDSKSSGELTVRIRFAVPADAQHPGGLSLYGETLGCYPLGPTLLLDMRR